MTGPLSRRRLLALGAVACAAPAWSLPAPPHERDGLVAPPLALPRMHVIGADGRATDLQRLLAGKVTALQLMFTGCSATCPIQGAIFADTQRKLARAGNDFRLLSISIDPLGDDPHAMSGWLQRFGAQPGRWAAAIPAMPDVPRLLDLLRGRAEGADRHTAQVYLIDRQARLVYRSAEMPAGETVVSLMQRVAAMPT